MQLSLFFLLAAIWGGSFVAIKFALDSLSFINAVLARIFIGFVFSFLFTKKDQIKTLLKLPCKGVLKISVVGVLAQALPFLLLFKAETLVSAGLAGIINGTVPLWTLIIGLIFFNKKKEMETRNYLGLIAGFIGMSIVCIPSMINSDHSGNDYLLGVSLLIGMAMAYSLGAIGAERVKKEYNISASLSSFYYHGASLLFILIFQLIINQGNLNFTDISMKSLWAVLYLGIFSNGIAFLIFYYLINEWGPTGATTVTYVVPGIAVGFDYLVFQTMPDLFHLIGMSIILISLIFVKKSKAKTSSKASE